MCIPPPSGSRWRPQGQSFYRLEQGNAVEQNITTIMERAFIGLRREVVTARCICALLTTALDRKQPACGTMTVFLFVWFRRTKNLSNTKLPTSATLLNKQVLPTRTIIPHGHTTMIGKSLVEVRIVPAGIIANLVANLIFSPKLILSIWRI